jgi:hypothetical protein
LFVAATFTISPAVPSKAKSPFCPAVLIATFTLLPTAMLPVNPTLATELGGGGTKKYELVTKVPVGVFNEICPDVAAVGTLVEMLIEVAEVTLAGTILIFALSFAGVRSKFVPLMVNAVPEVPIGGVKPVITGAVDAVTVKLVVLVADPFGAVIAIGPLVAPEGTATAICVGDADDIVALVPLNLTVSWLAVLLKPVPLTVTVAPTAPA